MSSSRRSRIRIYCGVALGFGILSILAVALKPGFDFVVSDGRGYYVYLPSLLVDGDLDFSNQISEHWGVDFRFELLEDRTPLGRVRNKYPIGMALTLAPAFILAHVVSAGLYAVVGLPVLAPNGYTGIYQLVCLAAILGLGLASMVLIDRVLEDRFAVQPTAILLGVLTYWIGSHYAYYYFREPFMVHVVSAFWVCACFLLVHRLLADCESRQPSCRTLAMLGLAFSMALVCRPTNVFLVPLLALLAWRWHARRRRVHIGEMALCTAVAAGPIALQMAIWRQLSGSLLYYSYGPEGFRWLEPHLLDVLFSSKHGLFFWAPVLLLSVWGLLWRLLNSQFDAFLVCTLVCFGSLWYLNSAWYMWSFGDAFGGRAFVEISILFVFGLAFYVEYALGKTRCRSALLLGLAIPCVVSTYALMALYIFHRIPRADYLF